MDHALHHRVSLCFALVLIASVSGVSVADEPCQPILPEQRCLSVRRPGQLCQYPVPLTPRPATVNDPQFDAPARYLTLNDAINITLANSDVVRVLGGVTASTSGRTIYDAAITNTTIDQQRAAFDPNLRVNNTWNQIETPTGVFDPLDQTNAIITGTQNEGYGLDFGLSKRNLLGGTANLGVNASSNRITPGVFPLNPTDRTATELSYTQALLQGAGKAVNQAPIVLARIDTERSYFQYKNAVQQSVAGVIEAYWSLVFAKTDLWARQQQVEQATFANNRTLARVKTGDASAGDLAQTQLALENFRATLLASRANVLQRQAALLNILGLPPYEAERTAPVTPMIDEFIEVDWTLINELAQQERPDIIELKLILEADQQRLLLADNQARPQLNGVALYRWNGLEGTTPAGNRVGSGGDYQDWSLGVNFSVPLGLRAERASLRQRQLIIQRDRANLEQGLHNMQHLLALSLRNLEQFYAQYERFQAVREAARTNLEQQLAQYNEGIVQFIVVLQAIVDWGNSVSAEAQSLSQYNTELARLELQTGTILQEHNVVFFEERFRSIGPLGRLAEGKCYPRSQPATPSVMRYEGGTQPSEEYFDLEDSVDKNDVSEDDDEAQEDINLDTDVKFQKIDEDQDGEMSDEEINKLLEKKSALRTFSDFLKAKLRR